MAQPRPSSSFRALALLTVAAVAASACGERDAPSDLSDIRRWEDERRIPPGDSLQSHLQRGGVAIRAAAARALGRIAHPDGIEALTKALASDDDLQVRGEAAFALGIAGHAESAPALVRALTTETDPEVLGEAALALGRLNPPGAGPELQGLLSHDHPHVREQAVEALALVADSTTVEPLLAATHDPVEGVAWRATYALEKLPRQEAVVDRLMELTGSDLTQVRLYALRSLGRLEAGTAWPVVAQVLRRDEQWRVRVNAADALGRMGQNDATQDLILGLADSLHHVRAAAVQSLARLGSTDAMPALLDRTRDESVGVRRSAYEAIATILEGRAFPVLMDGLKDPSPFVVASCLRSMGTAKDPRAMETLSQHLEPSHPAVVRAGATSGLGELGDAAAAPLLRQTLRDDDWVVATLAAEALGKLGRPADLDEMLAAYAQRGEPGLTDFRWQVISSLEQMADDRAIGVVRQALDHADVRIRLQARETLSALLPPSEAAHLPSEEELRKDVRPIVRSSLQPALVHRSQARQLVLETERGRILIDLFGKEAPQVVESFARLADKGFFDGLNFHRVVPNFVIQGGDPHGSGWGDPGYNLRSEWSPLRYERGMVGIATSGKDTGGCQLFITHSTQPHLNGRYTILGRVVDGMDVVDRIDQGDTFRARVIWANEEI